MRVVAALAIGYLFGSVLPAYLIGRARGIDLRRVGSGNPGTTNALHTLGVGPAVITGIYDVLKGIVAMAVAWRLGVSEPVVYAAGFAAWVGHHYPFYLGYHGAEGAAVTAGLLTVAVGIAVQRGWLSGPDLAIVAIAMLAAFAIFRRWPAAGVAGLAVGYALAVWGSTSLAFDVFAGGAVAHQLVHNVASFRAHSSRRGSPAPR